MPTTATPADDAAWEARREVPTTPPNIKVIVDRIHFRNDGQVLVDDDHFPFGIATDSVSIEPHPGGGARVTLTLYANEVVVDPPAPQEASDAHQELPVQDQGD